MESAPQEKAPSGTEVSLPQLRSPFPFSYFLSLEVPFLSCSSVLCPSSQRLSSANCFSFYLGDCWLAFVIAQLPTEPYLIYHVPEAGLSVRRYLHKPYLISGSKFDLRIYVYVTCYDPLRIYLFSDGLVRFASCKYVLVVRCHPDSSGDLLS